MRVQPTGLHGVETDRSCALQAIEPEPAWSCLIPYRLRDTSRARARTKGAANGLPFPDMGGVWPAIHFQSEVQSEYPAGESVPALSQATFLPKFETTPQFHR